MKKILEFKKNADGQALVEFALVLPILIALILGMVEFGWILNGKITLTSAAREGARFYAVSKDYSKVEETVKRTTANSGLNITDVIPDRQVDYFKDIHDVKVTVKGSIKPIIGLFIPSRYLNPDGSFPMESVAVMREE